MEKGDGWHVRHYGGTGRFILADKRQVPAGLPKNLLPLNETENGILLVCPLLSIDMRDLELTYHILVLSSDSHLTELLAPQLLIMGHSS